jgi:hypothetical protein
MLPAISELQQVNTPPHSPVKGKELYKGSKFYWRSRINVDLNFILHNDEKSQCLEVCAYNTDKSEELPRLRLYYPSLLTVVDSEAKEKAMQVHQESIRKDKFYKAGAIPDTLLQKTQNDLVCKYILDRINPVMDKIDPSSVTTMALVPLAGDKVDFAIFDLPVTEQENNTNVPSSNIRRRRKHT